VLAWPEISSEAEDRRSTTSPSGWRLQQTSERARMPGTWRRWPQGWPPRRHAPCLRLLVLAVIWAMFSRRWPPWCSARFEQRGLVLARDGEGDLESPAATSWRLGGGVERAHDAAEDHERQGQHADTSSPAPRRRLRSPPANNAVDGLIDGGLLLVDVSM